MLVIVDDSSALDTEGLDLHASDGEDWVVVADEVPIDEHERDALLERFQVRYQESSALTAGDDEVEHEAELEPDADHED